MGSARGVVWYSLRFFLFPPLWCIHFGKLPFLSRSSVHLMSYKTAWYTVRDPNAHQKHRNDALSLCSSGLAFDFCLAVFRSRFVCCLAVLSQAKQREFEERCQSLATAISLTQQEQIETCLTYRLFAVGQLHQRYRRLRLFFAQLGSRVGARESQAALLCGREGQAEERIKMVGVCLMLGVVEEACLKWTAVQNERQLVEGMNREVSRLAAREGNKRPPPGASALPPACARGGNSEVWCGRSHGG